MLTRRSALLSFLTSPLACFGASKDQSDQNISKPYRLQQDGTWQEIGHMEPSPGEVVIIIGLDEGRLWRLDICKVGSDGSVIFEGVPALCPETLIRLAGRKAISAGDVITAMEKK